MNASDDELENEFGLDGEDDDDTEQLLGAEDSVPPHGHDTHATPQSRQGATEAKVQPQEHTQRTRPEARALFGEEEEEACSCSCGLLDRVDACLESEARCSTVCLALCQADELRDHDCMCCALCLRCVCWCRSRRARGAACWFCETLFMPPGKPRGNVTLFMVAWGIVVGIACLTATFLAALDSPVTLLLVPIFVLATMPVCVCRRPVLTQNIPPSDDTETALVYAGLGDCAQGLVATLAPGLLWVLYRAHTTTAFSTVAGLVAWALFYTTYIGIVVAWTSRGQGEYDL